MLTLITGQPGNGKTLYAMDMMRREYERNQAASKLPPGDKNYEPVREFYSNIEGSTRQDNPDAFEWVKPMPEHRDWTKLPDFSFVIYDECHSDGKTPGLEHYGLLFPATGKPGEAGDHRIRAMSTHRHRAFDLVLMTQWPSKVHHNVRQQSGDHVHMNRALGLQRAGVLTWSRIQADPYDDRQREKAEEQIWPFPKDLYDKFRSATRHTSSHKFKVPKKAWQALSMVVGFVLVCWSLYAWLKPEAKASEHQAGGVPQEAASARGNLLPGVPPAGPGGFQSAEDYRAFFRPMIPDAPWTAPAFNGRAIVSEPQLLCIASGVDGKDDCKCYTEQVTVYPMDLDRCMVVARRGPAYNPYKAPAEQHREAGRTSRDFRAMEPSGSAPTLEAATGATGAAQVAAYGDLTAWR